MSNAQVNNIVVPSPEKYPSEFDVLTYSAICKYVTQSQQWNAEFTLNRLHPDGVFELSALKVSNSKSELYPWCSQGGMVGGWFDDIGKAVETALALDEEAGAEGIYVSCNPCKPELLGKAHNRLIVMRSRTKDEEIERLSNFFIDIDAKRVSGISASAGEKRKAHETLAKVYHYLVERLKWPPPIMGDSGNGYHLVCKIDLENTRENTEMLERCLGVLSHYFSTGDAEIDKSVANPGRLIKLYGTRARKGDPLEDRPHRLARIMFAKETQSVLDRNALIELSELWKPEMEGKTPRKATTAVKDSKRNGEVSKSLNGRKKANLLDLDAYLRDHRIAVRGTKPLNDGVMYVLEHCLFDSAHTGKDAGIIQMDSGTLMYRCFHNSCREKTWDDARRLISGDKDLGKYYPGGNQRRRKILAARNLYDLILESPDEPEWTIEKILPRGLTMLCGHPKAGKTFFAQTMTHHIATDGLFLGQFSALPGRVLYLALEDNEYRTKFRYLMISGPENGAPQSYHKNVEVVLEAPNMNNDGLECLDYTIQEMGPFQMVVIDTLVRFAPDFRGNNNIYQQEYKVLSQIGNLADKHDLSVVLVHHLNKQSTDNPLKSISGSMANSAAVDHIMLMEKGGIPNTALLKIISRDTEAAEYPIEFDPSNFTWSLKDKIDVACLNGNEERIVGVINDYGGSATSKQLQDRMETVHKVANVTTRVALSRMKKKRLLAEEGGYYRISG